MPTVRVANFFGGFPVKAQKEQLKTNTPHIIVGTPGRLKQVRLRLAVSSYLTTEAR
jgi:ATP-dependent RNA helicase UAP56/SUB2